MDIVAIMLFIFLIVFSLGATLIIADLWGRVSMLEHITYRSESKKAE